MVRFKVINGNLQFDVPPAFQLYSSRLNYVFKIVLQDANNVVDAYQYTSRSGKTSDSWYLLYRSDENITLKPIRGMWLIYNMLLKYNDPRVFRQNFRQNLTNPDTILSLYGGMFEAILSRERKYLIHIDDYLDDYGITIYDRFSKAETLILPLYDTQGHLEVYRLPDNLNLELNEGELHVYNHYIDGKVQYREVRDGFIVKIDDHSVITSEDHSHTVDLFQGYYLLVHTPPSTGGAD